MGLTFYGTDEGTAFSGGDSGKERIVGKVNDPDSHMSVNNYDFDVHVGIEDFSVNVDVTDFDTKGGVSVLLKCGSYVDVDYLWTNETTGDLVEGVGSVDSVQGVGVDYFDG